MHPFVPGGELPVLLTPIETVDVLRIKLSKLWRLTASGQLPCIRIGRAARYHVDDIRAWLEIHRTTAQVK